MWKDSNRNIVVIFQPKISRIVGFYVRHSAYYFEAGNVFNSWTQIKSEHLKAINTLSKFVLLVKKILLNNNFSYICLPKEK